MNGLLILFCTILHDGDKLCPLCSTQVPAVWSLLHLKQCYLIYCGGSFFFFKSHYLLPDSEIIQPFEKFFFNATVIKSIFSLYFSLTSSFLCLYFLSQTPMCLFDAALQEVQKFFCCEMMTLNICFKIRYNRIYYIFCPHSLAYKWVNKCWHTVCMHSESYCTVSNCRGRSAWPRLCLYKQ